MAGERRRLGGDALHQVAVGADREGVVVADLGAELLAQELLAPSPCPTALPKPWPSGPVVVSTPAVSKFSGWPGVCEPSCRNCLIWSSGDGRSPRGAGSRRAASRRGRPRARSGRGRASSGRPGCASSRACRARTRRGRAPSGAPGWPDCAAWTASTVSVRTVLMLSWSIVVLRHRRGSPHRRFAISSSERTV